MNQTLEKILMLLKEKGLKQKDLTEYLGLGKQTSTEWKSGRNSSYMKYISKIAEFLETDPNFLLGTENADKALSHLEFAFQGLTEDDVKIMEKTKQLPASKKKAILNLLEALEDKEDE